MKIVIAPDKFKGSLSAAEFCRISTEEIQRIHPAWKVKATPLADGGEGTLQVLEQTLDVERVFCEVENPIGELITVSYLFSNKEKKAIIEMAAASGLLLLPLRKRDCMNTTTYGTGQMIAHAIHNGAQHILLTIGGSATNDGGIGVAAALGFSFLDNEGRKLTPIGKNLSLISSIQPPKHKEWEGVKFTVACDVNNPFYGLEGAAYVYAAQKGANLEEIKLLDDGLKNLAGKIRAYNSKDIQAIKGSGAAGGLGGGMVAFFDAQLLSGIEMVMELLDFENVISDADLIITGEGLMDEQTVSGKTIAGVVHRAANHRIPVLAVCGKSKLTQSEAMEFGLKKVYELSEGITEEESMRHAKSLLKAKIGLLLGEFPFFGIK